MLELGDDWTDLRTLKAFLRSHSGVLRELSLRNIYLDGRNTWEQAALELGKLLKLNFIALSSMADAESRRLHENPYIGDFREMQTAISFMINWVPESSLGYVRSEVCV